MAETFTDLTPEGKRYFKELEKLSKLVVLVGFQSSGGDYEDGTSVVDVAMFNELGTSDTPARPFMRQSFETHEDDLKKAGELVNMTLAKGGTAEDALAKLGVTAVGIVQEEITDGSFEPNAPSTIRKKGSAKPLIDTGTMRQSVKYVVREEGSGG